jgi:hypothetical protein
MTFDPHESPASRKPHPLEAKRGLSDFQKK